MKARIRFEGEADQELADRIELIDESLRKSFSGFTVDEVLPELQRSLDGIGLELPSQQLQAYARAISARDDFELVLGR